MNDIFLQEFFKSREVFYFMSLVVTNDNLGFTINKGLDQLCYILTSILVIPIRIDNDGSFYYIYPFYFNRKITDGFWKSVFFIEAWVLYD